jgi:uncharacterized protein YbbK (DUF523 family)
VRYDGGHKRAVALIRELEPHVVWIPFCPEVELGLGVPREPIRLVEIDGAVRLRAIAGDRDLTAAMDDWATGRLDGNEPSGWVLKARSPSCGLGDAPLHDVAGGVIGAADGRFAAAIRVRWPRVPLRTENELQDAASCRRFLEAVRAWEER